MPVRKLFWLVVFFSHFYSHLGSFFIERIPFSPLHLSMFYSFHYSRSVYPSPVRFSLWPGWKFSCGLRRRVDSLVDTKVSEKHAVRFFRAEAPGFYPWVYAASRCRTSSPSPCLFSCLPSSVLTVSLSLAATSLPAFVWHAYYIWQALLVRTVWVGTGGIVRFWR